MSPDLLQRPNSDEDHQAADQKPYDDEFQKMLKRGQLGADPESKSVDSESLDNAEQAGGGVSGSSAGFQSEQSELEKAGLWKGQDRDSGGIRQKLKGKITRKKAAVGAGGIGGLLATLGIFGILQGPMQVVHFAQLLQKFHFSNNESFSDSRTGKLLLYFSTRDNPNQRNLGIIMNKPATRYQQMLNKSGVELDFDSPTRNGKQVRRIQGFFVDGDTDGGKKLLADLRKQGADIEISGERFYVSARGEGGTKLSRSVLRGAVDNLNLNKVSSALAKRLLIRRARVDFHPLKNKAYEQGQDRNDYKRSVREDAADADKNGVSEPDARAQATQEDIDGDGELDVDPDIESEVSAGNAEIDAVQGENGRAARERFRGLVRGGALAAGAVSVICTARSLGDQAEEIEYTNIVMPLIRFGTRIISTGNQVMSGRGVNMDELGAISETFYDEDLGSWASARSIQAERGDDLTGADIPPEAQPSQVGEKPQLFQTLDNSLFDGACTVDGFLGSLPGVSHLSNLSSDALDAALSGIGAPTVGELMESLAGLFAAEEVDTLNATGSLVGNYANYGARLAANDSAISMGGRELTETEVAVLDEASGELHKQERSQQSFIARMFNVNAADSFLGQVAFSIPRSFDQAFTALAQAPSALLSSFGRTVHAQEVSYDYGFSEYGFSMEEREDERLEDPAENSELVQPLLPTIPDNPDTEENEFSIGLNDRYGACFGMTVSEVDGSLTTGDTVKYEDIENNPNCSDEGAKFYDGTTELLRYRMYLADMVTAHSLACYEGEESSCQQLGFGGVNTNSSSPVAGDARGQDTSDKSCTIGTDAGLGVTPVPGTKIRLCVVEGIKVNVAIEENVAAAVNGARAAGIALGNTTAYRSYDEQVRLRRQNCGESQYDIYQKPSGQCSPETARPGTSLHEWGLAIDFKCNGGSVSRSGPCFKWLENNQSVHNLRNLPSEPWHWSSTGS